MTTGKTIALTRQTFVGKVMSLLFNMLSRLVIAFLPSSKHLLISWVQSPSAVILIIQEEIEVRFVESTMCPYQSGVFTLCCGTRNPEVVLTLQKLRLISFSCSMHRSSEALLISSFQDSCWWTRCHVDHADHWSRGAETSRASLMGK